MGSDKRLIESLGQPVYYVQSLSKDEVDLVDVWIRLAALRKTYLLALLPTLAIILGLTAALFEERYVVRSLIEVESFTILDRPVAVESIESLIKKIEISILPELIASAGGELNPVEMMATRVSNPPKTSLLVVENSAPASQRAAFSAFHSGLVREVMAGLGQQVDFAHNSMRTEIAALGARIEELKLRERFLDQELVERSAVIRETSESPDELLQSLREEIEFKKASVLENIELSRSKIVQLEYEMKHTGPRVLHDGLITDQRVGISGLGAYAFAVVLSVLVSALVTVGIVFNRKLRSRRALEGER